MEAKRKKQNGLVRVHEALARRGLTADGALPHALAAAIAEEIGLSVGTVKHHKSKLRSAGGDPIAATAAISAEQAEHYRDNRYGRREKAIAGSRAALARCRHQTAEDPEAVRAHYRDRYRNEPGRRDYLIRKSAERYRRVREDPIYRERCARKNSAWYRTNRDAALEKKRRWREENPAKAILHQVQGNLRRSRERHLESSLTLEDVERLLAPMTCAVTGHGLHWGRSGAHRLNPWAPSIDRVDNAAGYAPGNVQLVCWAYNQLKGEWTDDIARRALLSLAGRREPAGEPEFDAAGRATYLLGAARRRARVAGRDFDLSAEWVEERIADGACSVTGMPFSLARGRFHKAPFAPSLDRVDCSRGYTRDNVRVTSVWWNVGRADLPDGVVREVASLIATRT